MFDLQYIVLGLVQGLTEFLPISSSAHLILVTEFFDWNDQGLFNDIAVHVGTLGAVILYLYKDLGRIINDFFSFKNLIIKKHLFFKIIVATIPTLIIGLLVYKYFIYDLRNLVIIGYANIFFAIVLYLVDRFSISTDYWQDLSFKNVFFIGICQSLAFIPGASRAGVTITGTRLLGIRRDSSAIFSMLLSIPVILASITLIFFDIYTYGSLQINLNQTISSTFIAFITALVSIHFMMKVLKKTNFSIFVIYRIILGFILIIIVN